MLPEAEPVRLLAHTSLDGGTTLFRAVGAHGQEATVVELEAFDGLLPGVRVMGYVTPRE